MDRLACVDLPALPLQLLLKRRPQWRGQPVAVVDADKANGQITWVNESALKHHVLPGMRYTQALGLARDLRADVVNADEIAQQVQSVLKTLIHLTSRVEPSPHDPGIFWLDASGLARLEPSMADWGQRVRAHLQREGFVAHVVVGFTRFGTYSAAKSKPRGVTVFNDAQDEYQAARNVPLVRLGLPPTARDVLSKLGATTLGAFLDLPAAEIRRRFGTEVANLHRAASGDLWHPLQATAPEETPSRGMRFDAPVSDAEALLTVAETLLHPLLEELARSQQGVQALILQLELEDRKPRFERIAPAKPTLKPSRLLELMRLRLESLARSLDTEEELAITGLQLEAEAADLHEEQRGLFADIQRRKPDDAAHALAQLRAELGDDRVVWARLREGHLPEAQFRWTPIEKLSAAAPRKLDIRPLVRRLFARPVPFSLPTRSHHREVALPPGMEDGEFEEMLGPYVIGGGWWMQRIHRSYYFARTRSGRWLWLFFDGRRKRWFMHGEVE